VGPSFSDDLASSVTDQAWRLDFAQTRRLHSVDI
jgi:hypothetical protein